MPTTHFQARHFVVFLPTLLAQAATPALGACSFGPDQCKPGFVWREAFTGDHACVTGAERSQARADTVQARQRVLRGGQCKAGFVWREANAADHVCVSGTVRSQTAQQNRAAPGNIDPLCRDPSAGLDLQTEYARRSTAALPAKPSSSYISLRSDGSLVGVNRGPLAISTDAMWAPGDVITVSVTGGSVALRSRIQQYANEWSRWGNVRFSFVADPMQAQVRAEVNNDKTSWSLIGRGALGVSPPDKTMNFGWLTDATPDVEVSRVVLHEFGHALG